MKCIILDFFFKLFLLGRAYSACVNNYGQKMTTKMSENIKKIQMIAVCSAPMVNNWTKGKECLCRWEFPLTTCLQA